MKPLVSHHFTHRLINIMYLVYHISTHNHISLMRCDWQFVIAWKQAARQDMFVYVYNVNGYGEQAAGH